MSSKATLRTRTQGLQDALYELAESPEKCHTDPCPVCTLAEAAQLLLAALDADPDTPTADAPADDGLVEQVARIVHNSRSTIPMCGPESSGPCWPIARALVKRRPWQAEVEAARRDALNEAADALAPDKFGRKAQRWLRDRAARGETRQP